jgi:hypothetical protein
MGILDILLSRKNKKDTMENMNKTDESPRKIEINRQDIRDAMAGKNGKMALMSGVLIDTVTMREIPMRDKPSEFTTIRGTAASIQYFISSRNMKMPAKYSSANLMTLRIGEKDVNVNKDNMLPEINDGDDVEAMCMPSYSKYVLDVFVLKNHTRGTVWCFSVRKAALGF